MSSYLQQYTIQVPMTKQILITGGAGFIGHHLIEHILLHTDWNIITIDRLDVSGNLNRLHEMLTNHDLEVKKRVRFIFHDLRAELGPQLMHDIGDINVILHVAASSHVDRSILYPLQFVQDNIVGTAHILEYARKLKNLEKFIYFSTDEVFGPAPAGVSYHERDRYNSTNPYSATKAAGEELCVAYENTYGMPIYITHTMNVFGYRQLPEKFIPRSIFLVKNNLTVTVHSNPEKTQAGSRTYVHVKDVASAIMFLLTNNITPNLDQGGARIPKFNIVGPQEVDNLSLVQWIADAQGKELKYEMVDFHSSRPGHDLRYSLSGAYMQSLGWVPKLDLKSQIHDLVNWYLDNPRWLNS